MFFGLICKTGHEFFPEKPGWIQARNHYRPYASKNRRRKPLSLRIYYNAFFCGYEKIFPQMCNELNPFNAMTFIRNYRQKRERSPLTWEAKVSAPHSPQPNTALKAPSNAFSAHYFLLPYPLLPIAYCLLPISYILYPIPYYELSRNAIASRKISVFSR